MPTLTPVHMHPPPQSQCLVRMVNGAVDPSQNGKYAAPVMTLAKKIGIPVVLVDIRMEASHQELPSLALLRHGSERALQWLFERYWRAQRNVLDAVRDGACGGVGGAEPPGKKLINRRQGGAFKNHVQKFETDNPNKCFKASPVSKIIS